MSVTDYVIDILLILVIFRQVPPRELTRHTVVLPLALLMVAGIIYLKPIALKGNDLALIVILSVVGAVLGLLSGLADKVWRDGRGRLMYRVGVVSVVAWMLGMGRFSVSHDIAGARIWTTALVTMAFGQVLARLAVLQVRRVSGERGPLPAGPVVAEPYVGDRSR